MSRLWQQHFSVERVANKFYKEYTEVRNRMADALRESNPQHPIVPSLTTNQARAWATRQMGRVLFLWFLQAKRWLGEPNGQGSPTYLSDLWNRRSETPEQEYYQGMLLPLFFDAMTTGSSTDGENALLGHIPYLNGGLFRRNALEDHIDDGVPVSLPDEVFDPQRDDSLLGLLSRYRFTTRESTPDDQSVDPDPELLGRVFENLYQGDERHDTGTYYTPREIVHFMCRQALDGYLRDQVPGLEQETLDTLREMAIGSRDEAQTETLNATLANSLVDALETVRVCDPAVGSGAFLLGTLQEIVALRRGILFSQRDYVSPEELYEKVSEWKRRIVTHNLHGVDINAEAIEICQLRLWLSMVLDIAEPPHPNEGWALPNLDFRIIAGDSLADRVAGIAFKESWPTPPALQIGLDLQNEIAKMERTIARRKEEFDGTHRNPERLRELRDLINLGQREIVGLHLKDALAKTQGELQMRKGIKHGKNSEKQAQQRVDQLQSLLTRMEETDFALVQKPFLWPLAFPEVLREGDINSGFDIVLANPPYVRMEKLDNEDEQSYADAFPQVRASRADLLVYFYARALQILKPSGWLAFITSNSFTKRKYGEGLRGYLANEMTVTTLIDFGEVKVFDATVEPYVLVGYKSAPGPNAAVQGHNIYPLLARELANKGSLERVREEIQRLPEHLATEVSVFPQNRLTASEWRIEHEEINRLFEQLMNKGKPLSQFMEGRLYRGVVTGLNEAFVIDQAKHDELIKEDSRSAELIKPWLRGRDIERWETNSSGLSIIFANRGVDIAQYPAILEHLRWFRSDLEKRATSNVHPWYELQQPQEGIYHEFAVPKIIWPDIARGLRFSYDTSGCFLGNTGYIMPTNSLWLLTVLNSDLLEFILCQVTNSLRGGFMRLFSQHMNRLPIVTPDRNTQRHLATLARAGIAGKTVEDDKLNQMVNDLYGLTKWDAGIIRDWFTRRSLAGTSEDDLVEPC